jgi:hypothetical protein
VGGGSPGLQPAGRNLGKPTWAWRSHYQAGSSKWQKHSRGSADDVGDVIGGTAAGIRGGLAVRRRSRTVRRGWSERGLEILLQAKGARRTK